MVGTETELLIVTKAVAPLSKKMTSVTGVSGEDMIKLFCQPRKHQMGGRHQVIHEFFYIPECPVPLLGRDVLSKLGAQVTFSPEKRPTLRMDTMTYLISLSRYHPKMSGGRMSLQRKNQASQKSIRES